MTTTKISEGRTPYSMNPGLDALQKCSEVAQQNLIDDLNGISDFCLELSSVQSKMNDAAYFENAIADAKRSIDIAHGVFDTLAHADCVQGVKVGVCDGTENGSMTEQQKRNDDMFAAAFQYCPASKSHQRACQENPVKMPNSKPSSAAVSSTEDRVREPIQCGFVCRIWNGLKNIF